MMNSSFSFTLAAFTGANDLAAGSLSDLCRSAGRAGSGRGKGRGRGRGRGGGRGGRGRGKSKGGRGDFNEGARRGEGGGCGNGVQVVKAVAKASLSIILFEVSQIGRVCEHP